MKTILAGLAFIVTARAALPDLKVADDHRHLVTSEGKPFFLLGDTAWELFHRLTREETERYLENRAAKGFNTILAVALAEHEFSKPNAYGEMPLEENDPTKPRDAYFRHVDWVVDQAAANGLYTAILPTWGDKWNMKWGKGPLIFTPENAAVYGEWLGRRYENKPVIWILGGDRPVESEGQRAIIRAMAAGLERGDGGRHLMTFHPPGHTNSSDFWPDEMWLDFHMLQSGHGQRAIANYDMNSRNLSLPSRKPTLDGEPCYEDHPVRGLMKDGKPTEWFDEFDVRRAAWWSVLAGACGHVYGTHSVWQFHDLAKRKAQTDARTPWQDALDLPGAAQMGVLKHMMEGWEWNRLRRSDALLSGPWAASSRPMAAVADDGSFAVAYLPDPGSHPIHFNFQPLSYGASEATATAYNPATGEKIGLASIEGELLSLPARQELRLPRDQVLVVTRKTADGIE
ncbi:MAG: DUF4038 domain-containing protein [Akkermansiaceae bacterium]|nr:DUF4038 domain-containing protein [Akkermansiaceae bacterium]